MAKVVAETIISESSLKMADSALSHQYQGRIDFTTINLFHPAGMDLACILASREGLTNPFPRGKINQSLPLGQDTDQSSPCTGLSTHPHAMNTRLVIQC